MFVDSSGRGRWTLERLGFSHTFLAWACLFATSHLPALFYFILSFTSLSSHTSSWFSQVWYAPNLSRPEPKQVKTQLRKGQPEVVVPPGVAHFFSKRTQEGTTWGSDILGVSSSREGSSSGEICIPATHPWETPPYFSNWLLAQNRLLTRRKRLSFTLYILLTLRKDD